MKNSTKIVIIVVLLGLIAFNQFVLGNKSQKVAESVDVSTTKDESSDVVIGGDFSLTDQNGKTFTQEDLKGKYSLVFFGFTNCPMICPTALSSISLAMDKLGNKSKDVQAIFITTDPERDDQKRIKEFLSNFNSSIIGLTGSKKDLERAESAYKVYAEKVEKKDSNNYDMNHSSIIYLMDRDGKYLDHFNHESNPEEIAGKLAKLK